MGLRLHNIREGKKTEFMRNFELSVDGGWERLLYEPGLHTTFIKKHISGEERLQMTSISVQDPDSATQMKCLT